MAAAIKRLSVSANFPRINGDPRKLGSGRPVGHRSGGHRRDDNRGRGRASPPLSIRPTRRFSIFPDAVGRLDSTRLENFTADTETPR